jgi:RimJ/RimL family protein N-acetyltransferase
MQNSCPGKMSYPRSSMSGMADFWLEPWDERGLALERRANTPAMQAHLAGVEPDSVVSERHRRLLDTKVRGEGEFLLVMVDGEAEPVGSVGYWEREWHGETVFELAWKVLTGFQGRGLAAGATRAVLDRAAADGRHRWAHAYPKVGNAASNAVCARAGLELVEEVDFEYPRGSWIRCNDWRFDLRRPRQ